MFRHNNKDEYIDDERDDERDDEQDDGFQSIDDDEADSDELNDVMTDLIRQDGSVDSDLNRATVSDIMGPAYLGFDSMNEDYYVLEEEPGNKTLGITLFASPKSFPSVLRADVLTEVQNKGFGVSVHIRPKSRSFTTKELQSDQFKAEVQAYKELERGANPNSTGSNSLINNLQQIRNEIERGENKLYDVSLNFDVRGKSIREVEHRVKELTNILSESNIVLFPYSQTLRTGFLMSLPIEYEDPSVDYAYRELDMLALAKLDMGRIGNGVDNDGIVIGNSLAVPSMPLLHQSFFTAEKDTNYNLLAAGATGSGKSLYFKELIWRSFLFTDEVAHIYDQVNEYVELTAKLGQLVVKIDPASDSVLRINPAMYHLIEDPIDDVANSANTTVEEIRKRYNHPNATRKIIVKTINNKRTGEVYEQEFVQHFDKTTIEYNVQSFINSVLMNYDNAGGMTMTQNRALFDAIDSLINKRGITTHPDSLRDNEPKFVNGQLYTQPQKEEITISEIYDEIVRLNQIENPNYNPEKSVNESRTILDPDLIRLVDALDSQRDSMFDGQNTVNYDDYDEYRVVTFDLSSLQHNMKQQNVVESVLLRNDWSEFITSAKNAHLQKIIYLDEVLKHIDYEEFMSTLRQMILEGRKYESGIRWSIQDFSQLGKSKDAKSMVTNSEQKAFFRSSTDEVRILQEQVGINEGVADYLSSSIPVGTGVVWNEGEFIPFKTNPSKKELEMFESNKGRKSHDEEE